MELYDLLEVPVAAAGHVSPTNGDKIRSQGMMWYKYIPRTGCPGMADAEYAVLWPKEDSHITVDRYFVGKGSMKFKEVTWEELPFMYHAVNAVASLELLEFREASLTLSHGGSDFGGARIIE